MSFLIRDAQRVPGESERGREGGRREGEREGKEGGREGGRGEMPV